MILWKESAARLPQRAALSLYSALHSGLFIAYLKPCKIFCNEFPCNKRSKYFKLRACISPRRFPDLYALYRRSFRTHDGLTAREAITAVSNDLTNETAA
jgi:hypothetical protein